VLLNGIFGIKPFPTAGVDPDTLMERDPYALDWRFHGGSFLQFILCR